MSWIAHLFAGLTMAITAIFIPSPHVLPLEATTTPVSVHAAPKVLTKAPVTDSTNTTITASSSGQSVKLSSSENPKTYQIHITGVTRSKVSVQQEPDPAMKKGDKAEISVDGYPVTEVIVADIGASGSNHATFKVSARQGSEVVPEGQNVIVGSAGSGALLIYMEIPVSIQDNTATVHFNVFISSGDE